MMTSRNKRTTSKLMIQDVVEISICDISLSTEDDELSKPGSSRITK